jgi:TolA-binding protein
MRKICCGLVLVVVAVCAWQASSAQERRDRPSEPRPPELRDRARRLEERERDLEMLAEELGARQMEIEEQARRLQAERERMERELEFARREQELEMRERELDRAAAGRPGKPPEPRPGGLAGLIVLVVLVLSCLLWLWAMVNCLKRGDDEFPTRGRYDKLIWVIVLLAASVVGALLYLFLVGTRSHKETSTTGA